ncbi:unnamed protein product [Prunus armeniaca]
METYHPKEAYRTWSFQNPHGDWGPKVDVVFCFLDLASNYEPPDSLAEWLEAGEQTVYIGFDSLVKYTSEEPEKMTTIILQALEITGQRGGINRGWGGLVDNCPHDWLFQRCSAVCPTTIVPFFGDQPFWGERVHARGVGPAPIPADEFSLEKLVDALRFMLDPQW